MHSYPYLSSMAVSKTVPNNSAIHLKNTFYGIGNLKLIQLNIKLRKFDR
jgi:hypothetical protein